MDFILTYTLSFSLAHGLNLCMGFHPLPSPPITHFQSYNSNNHFQTFAKKVQLPAFMTQLYIFKKSVNIASVATPVPMSPLRPQTLDIIKPELKFFRLGIKVTPNKPAAEKPPNQSNWCLKRQQRQMFEKPC